MSQVSYTETLSTFMVQSGKNYLDQFIVSYAREVAKDQNIDESHLIDIWNKISPDCAIDLKTIIEKENKKKVNEGKKAQKKLEDAKLPSCIHIFSKNSQKAGQSCGKPQVKDGEGHCNQHKKKEKSEGDTKNTCCFEYPKDTKNNKEGDVCKTKMIKDAKPFEYELIKDCDYENNKVLEYQDKWLCKKHITYVTKEFKRLENPCTHEFTKKSDRYGETCGKLAVKGDKCKTHGPKEKKAKTSKSSTNKKKKGKKDNSDSDSDADEKPKKKKSESKKGKSKKPKEESDVDESDIEESDIEDEEPKKKKTESKKASSKKEEVKKVQPKKITSKISFELMKKNKPKVPKWETTSIEGQNDTHVNVFVDTVSGLTCINEDDPDDNDITKIFDTKAKKYNIVAVGIWNNDDQSYDDLDEDATFYAQAMNIELHNEDDEE
jgi:hypothetical protein